MLRRILLFVVFLILIIPTNTQATLWLYEGSGTGLDITGTQRNIYGEMLIDDQIVDPYLGYTIDYYYFHADGLFEFDGSGGRIMELCLLKPDGSIFPGANEFVVSGEYQGMNLVTDGPATFLHEDLTAYDLTDYILYDLPPFIKIETLFGDWGVGGVGDLFVCSNDFILKGTPVPEPATVLLLGCGLVGLGGLRKKFRKR